MLMPQCFGGGTMIVATIIVANYKLLARGFEQISAVHGLLILPGR
ncbi:hypothetical protein [Burkholderia aenigmatica]|nr:hypothetical protein [Burkholderia aenigmatica]